MNIGNNMFAQWNPMQSDYNNLAFNNYAYGPGAALHPVLQPAQLAAQFVQGNSGGGTEKQPVPCLIFKNLPDGMTTNALRNICSRHGRVREVRDSKKNNYYFVDMETVADMESALRALETNNYGFTVIVSTSQNKKPLERNQNLQNFTPVPARTTGIDYQNRSLQTSKKNHPRPNVKENSLLNESVAVNTGLPLNLLANDAHSLERQGLYQMKNNDKFNYRNGRSFVKMPEKTKQFIDTKHNGSSGTYDSSKDMYVHTPENSQIANNIKKCSQCFYACDTVCERCSEYYCSVECQMNDWHRHRYKCGKPVHLQKTPPSQKVHITESKKSPEVKKYKSTPDTKAPTVVAEKTLKGMSTEELVRFSKTPQQPPTVSKPAKKIPAILNKSVPHQNISNESCKQIPTSLKTSQQLPKTAVSSKKLPAALRAASKQVSDLLQETSSQVASTSSTVSSNNSKKPTERSSDEIYKQNMPRSGNIVTITAISKTNLVFVRSKTYDDNISYFNTVDTLQSLGKMLQPLKTLPKSGGVVIAKFEEQFNRALILNAKNPENVLVHFMDYGNMENARMENLFEAPDVLAYKPRHAIPVLLKDVSDFYMTQEVRKFMHSYLNNINVEICYKPEDFRKEHSVFQVELIDENTHQNLNKLIMKLSKPVEPQNTNEICDRNYLEQKILPVGKDVEFFVMDNSLMCSGCISCTIKPYAIEIGKFTHEIQAYVNSIPNEPYTPRVQELCIARYSVDGLWYRGLCLETVGDGHPSIHFIDYGNITFIPIEDIRRYPRQFTFPIYTADCEIEGLPEFSDDKLVAKLEDLIPNGEAIKCDNVTVDKENNFYFLSLPNVIGELNKCGLI